MDLATFAKMPDASGKYLKFTAKDNVKIVRFLYDTTPDVDEDLGIRVRKKQYIKETNTVVWDTPEGKDVINFKLAVYSSKTEYAIMTWERSAVFGRDTALPLFRAAGGKISDTVYKITATNAGTLDAKYNFFPLKDGDAYAVPVIEGESEETTDSVIKEQIQRAVAKPSQAQPTAPAPEPVDATPKKKNFWEV